MQWAIWNVPFFSFDQFDGNWRGKNVCCSGLLWLGCQSGSGWVYICTPPYTYLNAAQLSHCKRRRTKRQLCVMSFLNRQSSHFFLETLFFLHLSLLLLSLQGPRAAIDFNTQCSNKCSLELCTNAQQAGNKDLPPPSLRSFNLKSTTLSLKKQKHTGLK